MNVYAPTVTNHHNTKLQFYEDLSSMIFSVPNVNALKLSSDFG